MNIGDVFVTLRADDSKLSGDTKRAADKAATTASKSLSGGLLKGLSGQLAEFRSKGGIPGALMGGIGLGAGLSVFNLIAGGIKDVVGWLGDSVKAAADEQAGIERLNVSLKANDEAWDGNSAAVERVIASREKLGFADDEQRDSLAKLVAITGDVTKALDLQRQAMDLARLRGIALDDAATLLGKVYSGNTSILKRYGIQVEKGATREQALAAIQKQTAGQAEAYSKTAAGQMKRLDIAIADLQENVGALLQGPAADFIGWLNEIVDEINGTQGSGGAIDALADKMAELAKQSAQTTKQMEGDWFGSGTIFDSLIDGMNNVQQGLLDAAQPYGEWVRRTREVGEISGATGNDLAKLADAFQKSGKTFEEFQSAVAFYARDALDASHMTNTLSESVQTAATDIPEAVATIAPAIRKLPKTVRETMLSLPRNIKAAKKPIQAAMAEIEYALKHPLRRKNLRDYYYDQMKDAHKALRRAQREGNPRAEALAQQLIDNIQAKISRLNWAVVWASGTLVFPRKTPGKHSAIGAPGHYEGGGVFKGGQVPGASIDENGNVTYGHALGLSRVPYDGYMARLHADEAVLRKGDADRWRRGSGEWGGTRTLVIEDRGGGLARAGIGTRELADMLRSYEWP